MPQRAAICRHSVAKWPVSTISTLSPGDSVLTIAASQAPVPEEGNTITGPLVWKIFWQPAKTCLAEFGELGAAVVDDRHIHGAEHAVRHRARAGNLQEMASLVLGHGFLLWLGWLSQSAYCIQFMRQQPINCVQFWSTPSPPHVCSRP